MIIRPTLPETPNYTTPRGTIRTSYDGRLDRALSAGLLTERVCTILTISPA
jgi:hypothetical protein